MNSNRGGEWGGFILLLLAAGGVWFFFILPGKYKGSIELVLARDQHLSNWAENEIKRGCSHIEVCTVLVKEMRQIDLRDCPDDFRDAYLKHVYAWSELVPLLQKYDGFRGGLRAFLEGLTGQFKGDVESDRIRKGIKDTFYEVERAALKYGVQKTIRNVESTSSEWRGTCAQPNMAPYPMIMTVSRQHGNEISGTIHWPTLRNSTTRFSGTIIGTKVRFVETELIAGDGVGIPCVYEGDLLGNTMAGICAYAGENGTFSVTKGR